MDALIRAVAILVEVLILSTITFCLLLGVRIVLFDLGLRAKYKSMVNVVLAAVGVIALTFFIVHLTAFYPTVVR